MCLKIDTFCIIRLFGISKANLETSMLVQGLKAAPQRGFSLRFLLLVCVLALFAAGLFSCASFGAQLSAPLPQNTAVVSGELANGMGYRILKNGEPENRIFLRLAVKAGSVLEEDDQRGVAHLIEHMAFNGTEHFRENELVSYFESIGMTFGPEVNAYTSADETVYMLEVPADDPSALRTALLVLSDWASAITFDPVELDKERGVIIEEWRLGRGASGRLRDAQLPLLYAGSRYADRSPIGKPEIIRNISRRRVLDFYNTWYRPELMTAIIVGDCEPAAVEAAVKEILGAVPAKDAGSAVPEFSIPIRKEPAAQVVRDPELTLTTVQIISQSEPISLRTVSEFKANLVRRMLFSVFNERLAEALIAADAPLIDAAAGTSLHGRKAAYPYAAAVPKPGKFAEGFSFIMEKVEQLRRWGVTEAEAERARANFLASAEQAWRNRDKTSSSTLASSLLSSTLYNEPSVSIEDSYALYARIIPEITSSDLNAAIRRYFPGRGTLLLVSAPEGDAAFDVPSEDALMRMWQGWQPPSSLAPYSEAALERPLFDESTLVRGSILSVEIAASAAKGSEVGDVEVWTLSNGAKVIANPTAFRQDEILFSAYSPGGLSLVPDADYVSASVAANYAEASGLNGFTASQLEKKLVGKTVSFAVSIDSGWEAMSGSSSNGDLETLFQLINLSFTAPHFTDDAWATLVSAVETEAAQRLASPSAQFSDAVVRLRYGDNIRFKNMTPEMAASLNRDVAERVYRERFADAGDFVFIFTGSFDKNELMKFAAKYIAGLPSSGGVAPEKADISLFPPFPKGTPKETVRAGLEEQARVFISFGGIVEPAPEDFALFDSFCLLLDIRLRELVREELGGTYGISAYGGLSILPRSDDGKLRQFTLSIQFGCAPDSWQRLLDAVLAELIAISSAPASDADIGKVAETYRRSLETGLKRNSFVHSRILSAIRRGVKADSPEAALTLAAAGEKITAEKLLDMAKTYIHLENFIQAVLVPENYDQSAR